MIIAVTGHRPDKLGGYDREDIHEAICGVFIDLLSAMEEPIEYCISGMAQGVDQLFAIAALSLEIPVVAAVPAVWQAGNWPKKAQEKYIKILDECKDVVIVSPPDTPFNAAMHARNQWMVDRCTDLWAMWDGSPGGTASCISYCNKHYPDKLKMTLNPKDWFFEPVYGMFGPAISESD